MTTLTGQGFGGAAIVGRATRLDTETGRATLDESLLGMLAKWKVKEGVDIGLVLIADDALTALLLPLPAGAFLAGVVAQRTLMVSPHLPEGVVVIAGVEDALLSIGEGEMVLLDPKAGTVLVMPNAQEVARLQTRHRPRVLLGDAHAPAFTQSGRCVPVWGRVQTPADVSLAVAQGADGLFIEGEGWDEAQLESAVRAIGGGDVALLLGFDALDPETVVTLAAHSVLRWCLFPENVPTTVEDLRDELAGLITELTDQNTPAALPKLIAVETPTPGFDGVLMLSGELPPPDPDVLPWDAPPVYVRVAELFGELPDLEAAVEDGAAALIVDPNTVALVKERVRLVL